jgi:glutathione S-transferase
MNRLLTIPVSHYCEKARWALDLAGVPYREDGWPPAIHRLPLLRYRATTVPLLHCADGRVLRESTDIVRFAAAAKPELRLFGDGHDQEQDILDLMERFDRDLGPAARLLVYAHTIPDAPSFMSALGRGLPKRRRRTLGRLRPLATQAIARHLGLNDGAVRRAETTLTQELAYAERRRAGSRYLVGDRFTAADLTFAALGAPLAGPAEYGGAALADTGRSPETRVVPGPWAEHPASALIRDLYGRHRV